MHKSRWAPGHEGLSLYSTLETLFRNLHLEIKFLNDKQQARGTNASPMRVEELLEESMCSKNKYQRLRLHPAR